MNDDPFTFLYQIFSGFLGLLFLVLWLVLFSRVGDVRDEARRHTRLLEEIARNTRNPADANKPAVERNYIREESKAGIGWFLGILTVIGLLLFIASMATKK